MPSPGLPDPASIEMGAGRARRRRSPCGCADADPGPTEVNALFVNGKTIKPAARAFTDFLLRELRAAEDGPGQGHRRDSAAFPAVIWKPPLAIVLILPMCLLASVTGLLARGMPIDVLAQIGFVVLVGLAAKNAIRHCHVWTAPADQGPFFGVARVVGAVMSSAFYAEN